MPRLNQPLSLKKISLKSLVTHFELVCYGCCKGPASSQMIESELYLTVPGPFLQWPSALLEEILESVSEQRSVSRIVLHVVMQPHLQALNLSCGIGDVYYAIQFLQQRCQNIQQLDLSYISYLSPKTLSQLLVQLTQLTSLNLRLTLTTDQVLCDIGGHCSHLRELDVSVTPVTDRGLAEFTINSETGQPQGQELLRLAVTETRISPQGIARTLRFLPQLRQVEYESIFQAFDYVTETPYFHPHTEWEEIGTDRSCGYQLFSLKSTTELESGQTVSRATRLCPEVRSVSLVAGRMSVDAIQDIVGWKQLTELTLANGPAMSLDFWDSVLPILRLSGYQLRNLILTRFACVDILGNIFVHFTAERHQSCRFLLQETGSSSDPFFFTLMGHFIGSLTNFNPLGIDREAQLMIDSRFHPRVPSPGQISVQEPLPY